MEIGKRHKQEAADLPGSATWPSGDISGTTSPSRSLKPQSWILPTTTSSASILTESWSSGPSATSAQRPRASPASSPASSRTCSCCPFGFTSLSSGTTLCVVTQVSDPPGSAFPPGLVSSSKASAAYLLSHPGGGQVAVLAVGGPLESLEAKPGALSLRIRNQKGFVKLALEHGASLVPVFSFGENELFQQFPNPPGSWVRRVQETLQPLLRVALPLFHGRLGLLLPFRKPIHTVVGAPIQVQRSPRPSRAQVDALHALYVERLTRLFEEHKARYGVPADRHLVLT
ncbi:putative diacylglycerol O-acyltransferase 2-like protein DGAT2L7P isoform 2-T2 [Hipposideros larvatus]